MILQNQNLEPVVEYASMRLVTSILSYSQCNKQNPTLPQIVDYVVNRIDQGAPIKLFVCHYQAFGVWKHLRHMLYELEFPVSIEILIDDLDTFGAEDSMDSATLIHKEAELEVLSHRMKLEAADYFESSSVKVGRWSERGNLSKYVEELRLVKDLSRWTNTDEAALIETSLELNCDLWGYRSLKKKLGLTRAQFHQMMIEKVLTTAAQARWQANQAMANEAIVVWNSKETPNPLWRVILSNYDGQGYAPSLVFPGK